MQKSSPLLTDLYQLTMAYAAWKNKKTDLEAVFHLHFRKLPFHGGFVIAAGLGLVSDYLENYGFSDEELAYLSSLKGLDGSPLFESGFIQFLEKMKLSINIDAIPEGRVAFAQEPLLRIQGPLYQCQLLETPLLTAINFQTLVATKAARMHLASGGASILEFGLRRAQGFDGANAASRAAYIGGAAATSNLSAGMKYGIPVRGTHAHSWVMAFDTEREAFEAYADAMPNNVILLVDTYDTLQGVANAIEVGKRLKAKGHRLAGIRLDSGDLAYLSQEARKMLDQAGMKDAQIVASNDLNEDLIQSLRTQGASIQVWGVGTQLVTSYDQPALGGVYKLSAIRKPDSKVPAEAQWKYRIKLSEQVVKISTPGIQQVRRYQKDGQFIADQIYNERVTDPSIVDPADPSRIKRLGSASSHEDLLVPVFRGGRRVLAAESLVAAKERVRNDLAKLHSSHLRFLNPHEYPVGLDPALFELKAKLVRERRAEAASLEGKGGA